MGEQALQSDQVSADFLVIGAGMAGMTAAARAASSGAVVVVVEKGPALGGSAVLSAGGVVAPASYEPFRKLNPSGDADRNHLLIDRYDDLVAFIESLGTHVDFPPEPKLALGHPPEDLLGQAIRLRVVDMHGYMDRCETAVTKAGGWVVVSATVESLVVEDGAVVGAQVRDRDGVAEIRAPWTLLATGGFQNDRDLLLEHLGPQAQYVLVRSNPNSSGDGLKLASAVGASTSEHMDGFYGHPIMWPLNHSFEIPDYSRLALSFIAPFGVTISRNGKRVFDESLGYWVDSQMILRQEGGRALVIGDAHLLGTPGGGGQMEMGLYDRMAEARKSGAHAAQADTLKELEALVAEWGYTGVEQAVEDFNRQVVSDPDSMTPPRSRNRRPLDQAPYFAIEAQSSVTFTFGGVRIDTDARVLDGEGRPITGLLAAGADAGGFYHEGYCGGLGMSGVTALQAADLVSRSLQQKV